jgi:hypothetical protein
MNYKRKMKKQNKTTKKNNKGSLKTTYVSCPKCSQELPPQRYGYSFQGRTLNREGKQGDFQLYLWALCVHGKRERVKNKQICHWSDLDDVYVGVCCVIFYSECLKYYIIKANEWVPRFETKQMHLHSFSSKCTQ